MSQHASNSPRSPLVLLSFLFSFAVPAASLADARISERYGKLPLHFEANQGQTNKDVQFVSRGAGYSLYLTANEAVLVLAAPNPDAKREGATPAWPGAKTTQVKAVALRMSLVGAVRKPRVGGIDELPGKANYFIDNNPARWRTHVPTYAKVQYREVYPGIDLVYYGNQRELEHDFVVAPGANPKKIVLDFEGAEKIEINAEGDLVLHTAAGIVRQRRPVIYQTIDGVRREIDGAYVLKGAKRVGFKLATYDRSLPLVIDPVLSYSTYLGSGGGAITGNCCRGNDHGTGIAVDADGNAYITGDTFSDDFPTTAGAFQTAGAPSFDVFVTKLNPSGSALIYSTYLGGSGAESGGGIELDADGSVYVSGHTSSSDFPTTPGAFQTAFGGSTDRFVTKLNSTGSGLVYSTYVGGSGDDQGGGIAVDAAGNAYITGLTSSTNFPTTTGALQPALAGGVYDAYVAKLNSTGSALIYSTYLGGSSADWGSGITLDSDGNAYVSGTTSSTNFPTTAGAFQPTFAGGLYDAFVAKLDPAGSALVYATYLGGNIGNVEHPGREFGGDIAVDADGNTYVTGFTSSSNFPTTAGAFRTTFAGGFVTKLDPTGSAPVYSTYLGDTEDDAGNGIAVDANGNAYVTGITYSGTFPTTPGAFQSSFGGSSDAFVTKLNATGSALIYSTYLGGTGPDWGAGIARDSSGNVYVTGSAGSTNFPTTPGAFQSVFGGGGNAAFPRGPRASDAFVAKFIDDSTAPNTIAASSPAANAAGWNNSPVTVTLSATDNGGGSGIKSISYSVNAGAAVTVNGATASFTLSTDGVYTVSFNATDNAGNPEASRTLLVRIDQTPPSGTLSLSPSPLWPPNHKLVTITPSLSVSDAGGGPVSVSGPIVSSNEPVTGSGDDTSPDWVVSGDTLQLRAERAEGSSGRVYTVSYTLTDQAGNSAQASSTVTVPKSR